MATLPSISCLVWDMTVITIAYFEKRSEVWLNYRRSSLLKTNVRYKEKLESQIY